MGETLSPWIPSCNGSIRVELDGHRTTSDSGALLLREALDNSGVVEALKDNLVDQRASSTACLTLTCDEQKITDAGRMQALSATPSMYR